MDYGLKYELLCTSKSGNNYITSLSFADYTGPLIDRNVPLSPFKLRKDSKSTIRGTSFEFSMREVIDFEFMEFYTNSSRYIKVLVLGGQMGSIWTGYVLPQQYQVPYVPPPATVTFLATDGLGLLKNEQFLLTGERCSQLAIVAHCLNKAMPLSISVAINTFEANHNTDTDPLSQTFEDPENYAGLSCYEVLEKILNKYDAEVTQSLCMWAITCSADKKASRVIYTSEGDFEETGEASPVLNLGYPGEGIDVSPRGRLNMSLQPGANRVTISHNYGRKDSLLANNDFSLFDDGFPSWDQNGQFTASQGFGSEGSYALLEGFGGTDGYYIAQQKVFATQTGDTVYFSYKIGAIGYYLYGGIPTAFNRTVRLMVSITDGTDTYYLIGTGDSAAWVETQSFIEHDVLTRVAGTPKMNLMEFYAPRPPVDGTFEVVLYQCPDNNSYGPDASFEGLAFSDVNVRFINDGADYASGISLNAVFDESSEPASLDAVSVLCADAPASVPNNALLYQFITWLEGDIITGVWNRQGSSFSYPLIKILAKILASNNRVARQVLKGQIKGSALRFDSVIKHAYNNNREFEIAEGTWDLYEETWDVTLLELLPFYNMDVTFSEVITTSNTTGTGSGGGTGGGTSPAIASWLESVFELINEGQEDEYLRCKLPLAGDYNIQGFSDFASFPGLIWANMPYATETTVGGVKVDGETIVIENGIIRATAASEQWVEIENGYDTSLTPKSENISSIFLPYFDEGEPTYETGLVYSGNGIRDFLNPEFCYLDLGTTFSCRCISGGYEFVGWTLNLNSPGGGGFLIQNSNWMESSKGEALQIVAGRGNPNIIADGGDLFLSGGIAGDGGEHGDVYLGTNGYPYGAQGSLKEKTTETNVVYYNPTTGLLTYGAAGSGGNASALETTNFTVAQENGKLVFKYGTTVIVSIDADGVITSADNIQANGTP